MSKRIKRKRKKTKTKHQQFDPKCSKCSEAQTEASSRPNMLNLKSSSVWSRVCIYIEEELVPCVSLSPLHPHPPLYQRRVITRSFGTKRNKCESAERQQLIRGRINLTNQMLFLIQAWCSGLKPPINQRVYSTLNEFILRSVFNVLFLVSIFSSCNPMCGSV